MTPKVVRGSYKNLAVKKSFSLGIEKL